MDWPHKHEEIATSIQSAFIDVFFHMFDGHFPVLSMCNQEITNNNIFRKHVYQFDFVQASTFFTNVFSHKRKLTCTILHIKNVSDLKEKHNNKKINSPNDKCDN